MKKTAIITSMALVGILSVSGVYGAGVSDCAVENNYDNSYLEAGPHGNGNAVATDTTTECPVNNDYEKLWLSPGPHGNGKAAATEATDTLDTPPYYHLYGDSDGDGVGDCDGIPKDWSGPH